MSPQLVDPYMQSHIDVKGEVDHGYTKDDSGTIWYWEWDGTELTFTDRGTPSDHPIRTGNVPEDVRKHAKTHIGDGL